MTNTKRVIRPRKYQYESRCMGTVFFRNGAMRASQPNRSSSHVRTLCNVSDISSAPYENLLTAHLDLKAFQRPGRRTRNVPAIQVVCSVMASAPDLMKIISILHRAREVSAGSRHRAVLAVGNTDQ